MRTNIDIQDFMNREGKHKVIDISRNYKTGKVDVIEREKPNQAMINSARILMRNADTGRLESESIAHNIVHTGLLNAYGFLTAYYDRVSPKAVTLSDPFGAIILSDYDSAESQDDLIVGGNVMGWAGKTTTYVGTDIYKGTYTAADSSIVDGLRTGSIKYVYDWPRKAANGTIKSVWWNYCSGGDTGLSQEMYFPTYWGNNYSTWPSMIDCCCDGTYLYAVNNDGYIRKYNLATGALDSTITFNTNEKLRGIEWDGVNFWLQNVTGNCFKCAVGTFAIIATVGTIPNIDINGITVVNSKIYVSTTSNIYRFGLNGTQEQIYSPTDFGATATGFYKIKGNNKYLVVIMSKAVGYIFAQMNLDGTIKHVKDANSYDGLSHYRNFAFIRNTQYNTSRVFIGKEQGYNTTYWRWYMLPSPGAHSKLVTPEVKQNTKTMTVEYTFNCDLTHLG